MLIMLINQMQIKPIRRPEGHIDSESSPQMFVATSSTEITLPPPPVPPPAANVPPVNVSVNSSGRLSTGTKKGKDTDLMTQCNVCDTPGTNQNLVMLVLRIIANNNWNYRRSTI